MSKNPYELPKAVKLLWYRVWSFSDELFYTAKSLVPLPRGTMFGPTGYNCVVHRSATLREVDSMQEFDHRIQVRNFEVPRVEQNKFGYIAQYADCHKCALWLNDHSHIWLAVNYQAAVALLEQAYVLDFMRRVEQSTSNDVSGIGKPGQYQQADYSQIEARGVAWLAEQKESE